VGVLVAHDEPYVCYALSGFLRVHGCEVIAQGHDPNCADLLQTQTSPDLFILGEPATCTTSSIARLRKRFPNTRIALFAADVIDPQVAQAEIAWARTAGFDAFLSASLDESQLVSSLQRALVGKKVFPQTTPHSCQFGDGVWQEQTILGGNNPPPVQGLSTWRNPQSVS
jgi:DNA-binding NarL/FixJ family response regulator